MGNLGGAPRVRSRSIMRCTRPAASRSRGAMSDASGRSFQYRTGISARIMRGFTRAGLKVCA